MPWSTHSHCCPRWGHRNVDVSKEPRLLRELIVTSDVCSQWPVLFHLTPSILPSATAGEQPVANSDPALPSFPNILTRSKLQYNPLQLLLMSPIYSIWLNPTFKYTWGKSEFQSLKNFTIIWSSPQWYGWRNWDGKGFMAGSRAQSKLVADPGSPSLPPGPGMSCGSSPCRALQGSATLQEPRLGHDMGTGPGARNAVHMRVNTRSTRGQQVRRQASTLHPDGLGNSLPRSSDKNK